LANVVLIAFILVIFLTAGLTYASNKLYRFLRVRGKVYVAAWDEDAGNIHIGLYRTTGGNRIEVPGDEKKGVPGKVYLLAARGRKTLSGELSGVVYPVAPRYGHNLALPRSGELVEARPQRRDATYAQMVSVDGAEVTGQPESKEEARVMEEALASSTEPLVSVKREVAPILAQDGKEVGRHVMISVVAPSDAELHRSSKQWRMLGIADPASLRHAIYHNEAQDALHHNKPKQDSPAWVTLAIIMGALVLLAFMFIMWRSIAASQASAEAAKAAAQAQAAPVVTGSLLLFARIRDRLETWRADRREASLGEELSS